MQRGGEETLGSQGGTARRPRGRPRPCRQGDGEAARQALARTGGGGGPSQCTSRASPDLPARRASLSGRAMVRHGLPPPPQSSTLRRPRVSARRRPTAFPTQAASPTAGPSHRAPHQLLVTAYPVSAAPAKSMTPVIRHSRLDCAISLSLLSPVRHLSDQSG